jgi:hypothetical protein
MLISVFLARLLGPYCIIVALGVLLNLKVYRKVMEDFFKNTALVYLGGVIALIIGLLVVLLHNVWAASWTVIITIFGWAGIIKGVWLIVLPKTVVKFVEAYQKNTALLVVHLVIVLVIGVALTFFGYLAG